MEVVRLSALRTDRLSPQNISLFFISFKRPSRPPGHKAAMSVK